MISIEFYTDGGGRLRGFHIEGHSGTAEAGNDIVCAAVSSAAYMTANTVTDVLGVKASAVTRDGFMILKIDPKDAEFCMVPLKGFQQHMEALREEYPKNIRISHTEV